MHSRIQNWSVPGPSNLVWCDPRTRPDQDKQLLIVAANSEQAVYKLNVSVDSWLHSWKKQKWVDDQFRSKSKIRQFNNEKTYGLSSNFK